MGVEPTLDRLSTCRLYQLAYPVASNSRGAWDSNPACQAYETRPGACPPARRFQLRTWELNPASRLMRPGRAPARPQFIISGDGGIRTHTVHVLSVATPSSWSTSPEAEG